MVEKEQEIPKRKKKLKRGSDFRRLENVKKEASYTELPNSARASDGGDFWLGRRK